MNKIRVYELAKKLNKTNKEIMAVLNDLGAQVKTHFASIDDDTVQRVENAIAGTSGSGESRDSGKVKKEKDVKANMANVKDAKKMDRLEKPDKLEKLERLEKTEKHSGANAVKLRNAAIQQEKQQSRPQGNKQQQGGQQGKPQNNKQQQDGQRKNGNNKRDSRNKPVQQSKPAQTQSQVQPQAQPQSQSQSEDQVKQVKPGEPVKLRDGSTVKNLAEALGKSSAEAVKALMSAGLMLPATARVDDKVIAVLSKAFGVSFEMLPAENPDKVAKQGLSPQPKKAGKGVNKSSSARNTGKPGVLVERPPIVTVMGHVDHGKTTLLDQIRHANVTAQEAGGITQHIGAYIVVHDNKQIVFLDTPGHEAFTAMRARGANVTDVVILVVAADDGVMPQTLEAISHIKAANVPLVVAVNKIDKPGAKPERIRQQLADVGLVPEEWGGDVVMVDVSAKKGLGIPQLLEMVLLVAEMQELKGEPAALPTGVVIEAQLDKGKGPVATVIVQNGTLQRGDIVLFKTAWGKIRALLDWSGKPIKKAGPSIPVEILGLDDVPQPGETFTIVESEREARAALAEARAKERDAAGTATAKRASLDDLYSQMQDGQKPQLNLVVKCDVQGSLEALCASLEKLATSEVGVSIIHKGVGRIAESDVMLASTSNAIIIGFNVRPDANAKRVADLDGVEIRTYNIIYDVIDEVKAAMGGLLKPILREDTLGEVEIRQIFSIPKVGNIAGSHVMRGVARRGAKVRVIRDGVVIADAKIATLRHLKDEAREVKSGMDCGIGLEGYKDFKVGDTLEVFELIEERRSL